VIAVISGVIERFTLVIADLPGVIELSVQCDRVVIECDRTICLCDRPYYTVWSISGSIFS